MTDGIVKKIALVSFLLFIVSFGFAQNSSTQYVKIVVHKPHAIKTYKGTSEFPGGQKALLKYLSSNIHYPAFAKEKMIQGKVLLQFLVRSAGDIDSVIILHNPGDGLGEESQRVVSRMPKWITEKGKKTVNVKYKIRIDFQLNN